MKIQQYISLWVSAVIFAMTLFCLSQSLQARKIKTRHSIPKETRSSSAIDTAAVSGIVTISIVSDSIAFCDTVRPAVRFYGFDKTITSTQESFFISNGLDKAIKSLEILITYSDMKGRQLHKRTVSLDCDIPSGETKRTDIKSWDTQKSFYYHKSLKPKRQSTPFDVHLDIISVTLR